MRSTTEETGDSAMPARERNVLAQRSCCLHIGMPKTATKTLQTALFSQHPEVHYLGIYSGWQAKHRYRTQIPGVAVRDSHIAEMFNELLWDRRRSPDLDRSRELHRREIQPALDRGLVPLWSWESMVEDRHEVQHVRARNLKAVFGLCKVLVVIRHPIDLIESLYLQLLFRDNVGGRASVLQGLTYPSIDHWLRKHWNRDGHAPRAHLEYAEAIEIFAQAFGRHAVGIFLFEQLKENPQVFMRGICRFLEIDEDRGVRLAGTKVLHERWRQSELEELGRIQQSSWRSLRFRFASRRERRAMLGIARGRARSVQEPARIRISEALQERIRAKTKPGNRRLAEAWNLPLQEYGYPI